MNQLKDLAKDVGQDWISSTYYDDAEKFIDIQWDGLVWPFINGNDFTNIIDLAAGHGRNTEKLKEIAKKITIVDINSENIEYCRLRFENDNNISFMETDGISLHGVEDSSVTFIYCFDAMVHFDSDVVRNYLKEFQRVLVPGGRGFCHHSNHSHNPGGSYRDNPGWRNYMSDSLFSHYCQKEGLKIIKQKTIDWIKPGDQLDCVSLFEK